MSVVPLSPKLALNGPGHDVVCRRLRSDGGDHDARVPADYSLHDNENDTTVSWWRRRRSSAVHYFYVSSLLRSSAVAITAASDRYISARFNYSVTYTAMGNSDMIPVALVSRDA